MRCTRRQFLMHSAAVYSALGMAPSFLAQAAGEAARAIEGFEDDRVLVVVQLGGGNDGLNTVVPHNNDLYYRLRPTLGLKKDRLLRLDDDFGLNRSMEGLLRLYDEGKAAIIHGVGYPNPDRSHFRSMEIWHTASDADEYLGHGWIGRYFDNCCNGRPRPQAGVALGNERPQAFEGRKGLGISTADPRRFGWIAGEAADNADHFARLNAPALPAKNASLDFLRHTTQNAVRSSTEVQAAAERGGVGALVGGKKAGADQLSMVAGLIRGGLSTRIYYVSVSGFDTHSGQLARQDRLLALVGESLLNFQRQLEHDGTADRVVTMVFSEFGRRVAENGSGGTDHGTAAPLFLIGSNIRPGMHGRMPALDDLDAGDLKYTTDFRAVYATLLERWLNADSTAVLHHRHELLPLLA
jgi:uncharacterized protein (DUF1501 family)